MLRKWFIKLTAKVKSFGLIDRAIRYNPLIRHRVQTTLSKAIPVTLASASSLQQTLEKRILQAAQRTTYGKVFKGAISEWPVLRKPMLFSGYEKFINPGVWLRVPASTGGTSGIPLKLMRSLESVVAEQVFIDGLLTPYGGCMRTSVMAVLRADSVKNPSDTSPPYGMFSHGGNRLTLSTPHLSSSTIHWYHDTLSRLKPRILWAYPNAAASLMALLKQEKLTLNIPVLLLSSETLLPESHKALEDFFHCTVINYYGQAERACFAYSTQPGVFYFNPFYGKVELEELPTTDTEPFRRYRILGTGFWNRCMPLIRYDTDDVLYLPREYGAAEINEICMGLRPFSGIAGREGEYILTRDGVKIIGLNTIPREVKHIAQLQIVQQDYETVIMRVLPLPAFSDADKAQLLKQCKAKLPGNFTVSIDTTTPLFTTERGKIPYVVNSALPQPGADLQ